MAGQPTKHGNWGTRAVIDYPGRKYDTEASPFSHSFQKSKRKVGNTVATEYICKFAAWAAGFICENRSSASFGTPCNNCLHMRNATIKIGSYRFLTKKKLLEFLVTSNTSNN